MTDGAAEIEETTDRAERTDGRARFGSLGSILLLLFVAWSARLALLPLNDNSFFTHLATGRLILDRGSVPSTDPYTFTAVGEPWVVQSWLVSVAYAGAERVGGATGLKLLVLVFFVVATLLLWRLSRHATSLLLRIALVAAALGVSSSTWSERPYMVGVIGLSLVWLALEADLPPISLVPVMWIWVNSHGSFVLAAALVVAYAAGAWLDARALGGRVDRQPIVRTAVAVAGGSLLAAIGPLGFDVLLFPANALSRSDVLGEIVEWQAPDFTSANQLTYVVMVLVAVMALIRLREWRYVLPVLGFVAASLVAQRNIVMATVVLVPVIARAAPAVGTLRSDTRPIAGGLMAAMTALVVGLVVYAGVQGPQLGLGGYPTRTIAWLDGAELRERTATQDFTGNLLGVLDGPEEHVFIDDRADMFPREVLQDYLSVARGRVEWSRVLDEYGIDLVVWRRADPTGSLLAAHPEWRVVFSDTEWMAACRRAAGCRGVGRG